MSDHAEALLAELRDAMRAADEVPPRFLAAGRAAFAWRTVDADLADLTHDSTALAGTRTETAGVRSMTFVAPTLTIEVEILPDGLAGQLVPAQPGRIEIQHPDGRPRSVSADAVGWFMVAPPPSGLFRIKVTLADGTSAVTPWVQR
jgi:hypothetical protein